MKKLLAILLCLVMVLGLAACGGSDDKAEDTTAAASEETTAAAKEETTAAPAAETTAAPEGEDGETKEAPSMDNLHPLYLIEDRNNLQGLISPVQLVDRSGIEKALPTEQKSDLFLGYSGGTLISSFFVDIQNGFIDQCEEYGYKHSELYTSSMGDTAGSFTNVDTLIAQSVDGIVLSGDSDAIGTQAETCVNAGIPCDSINVPNDIMNHMITAVTNGDFNGGYVTGLDVGENLYYPQWKDQADPVRTTVMFGTAGNQISMSKLCGILTGIIESVTKLQGNPMIFEDAAFLANGYITDLALNGSLDIPEINMSIKGYGEGQWVTADALSAAEDLFTATPDMQLMMCDNDYMAIGGILVAQAIGVNVGQDCFIFACSDGTMVALEYVRDGLMYCTGVNCAYALGYGNVEIFHMVYEEGFDASDMPNQTLVDSIPLTIDNWEQYYDPSIELVRETTIQYLTTAERRAQFGL